MLLLFLFLLDVLFSKRLGRANREHSTRNDGRVGFNVTFVDVTHADEAFRRIMYMEVNKVTLNLGSYKVEAHDLHTYM